LPTAAPRCIYGKVEQDGLRCWLAELLDAAAFDVELPAMVAALNDTTMGLLAGFGFVLFSSLMARSEATSSGQCDQALPDQIVTGTGPARGHVIRLISN
jgi:hypothetical protein